MSNNNRDIVTKALIDVGITNPISIAAIMAIISKESNFNPQSEKSYATTSNARIKEIFSITRPLSEVDLSNLKKDPVKFFNYVYGGKFGNSSSEGYKYRGRGFNQLTFKGNYKKYGDMLGIDLVGNPDLVNNPSIAAKVVAIYMKSAFKDSAPIVKKRYGANNVNDFRDIKTAVNAFYNANAGFGKDTSTSITTGKTQALSRVDSLYKSVLNFVQGGGGAGILTGLVLLGTLYYLNK